MELRPYQRESIDDLRGGYRSGARRQLLVSPTGSGKTCTFAFIAKSSAAKGQRTLILTHRAEILGQISKTLKTVGVDHAILQAGMRTPKTAKTVVASIGTLVRRLDEFPAPDLIICDEAHHLPGETWTKVIAQFNCASLLGVTATPERLDGKGLGAYFDRMVRGPEVQWLIDNGFLARPRYFTPERLVDTSALHKVAGDFNRKESAEAVDKPTITGDAVQQYRKHCLGKRAVVFCVSVAHAEHVAEYFSLSGIPAASIDGTMTDDERSERIARLTSGNLLVLTSCELISEGFDLPVVDAAILMRPTHSLAMHLQQVGRCLRTHESKPWSLVLDHVGNCLRHGLAEERREWSLDGREKRKALEKEVLPRRCEKCFCMFTSPKCPECGETPESKARVIENVEGQLREISPEEIAKIRAKRQEEGMCRTYEDFAKLAKIRKYAPGWAYFRWKNSRHNKPKVLV